MPDSATTQNQSLQSQKADIHFKEPHSPPQPTQFVIVALGYRWLPPATLSLVTVHHTHFPRSFTVPVHLLNFTPRSLAFFLMWPQLGHGRSNARNGALPIAMGLMLLASETHAFFPSDFREKSFGAWGVSHEAQTREAYDQLA